MNRITILITSLFRPGYLKACLAGIKPNLPECSVIVVDDSGTPIPGAICLPYDSGLTVKRNAGVKAIETEYTLLGSDDFDFGTPEARRGIEHLLDVLEKHPEIDIASGRHNHQPYEGFLHVEPGKYIKETRLVEEYMQPFQKCDLTVNYFLARTSTLREVPWDEDIKPIGGEHGQFFLHLKEAGKTVVWVPGVNVDSLPANLEKFNDPRYAGLRGRAAATGHKTFLAKRGVTQYLGFDDQTPPRILIAITTCGQFKARANVQRRTWVKDVVGADVKFFLGRVQREPLHDEVLLDADDSYTGLPRKVQLMCEWALAHGYDYIFKTDDDTLVIPKKLLATDFRKYDYIGRYRGPSGTYPCERDGKPLKNGMNIYGNSEVGFASGLGYWLSAKAAKVVVKATINDWAEDRWVGQTLAQAKIKCHPDPRYILWPCEHPYKDVVTANPYNNTNDLERLYEHEKRTGLLPRK